MKLAPQPGYGLLEGTNNSKSYPVTFSSHTMLHFTMPRFEGTVNASLQFLYSDAVQTSTLPVPVYLLHAAPPVISAVYSASLTDDPCLLLREYPLLQHFLSANGTVTNQTLMRAVLGGGNATASNGTNVTSASATAAVNDATATILYMSTPPPPLLGGDRPVLSSSTAELYAGLWDDDLWAAGQYPYNASLVTPVGGVTPPYLISPAPCFPSVTSTGVTPQVSGWAGG